MQKTDIPSSTSLRVTEIFYSLQGESTTVGLPTVFIRLTGCPLRCTYCDTTYAFKGGRLMNIADILEKISNFNTRFVTVTGGEPLAQKDCLRLLSDLCDQGYQVSLETSGAIGVEEVDKRVMKVIDLKTPDSGEMAKNLYSNINYLRPEDQIKFVICSRADYEWAVATVEEYKLYDHGEVLFSPSYGQIEASVLADWIINDQLKVRFQIQLHKILWGDERAR